MFYTWFFRGVIILVLLSSVWLTSGDTTTVVSRSAPTTDNEFQSKLKERKEKKRYQFFCDFCGEKIARKYWLPLFGYINARGKAQCCGKRIPPTFYFVEVVNFVSLVTILSLLWRNPLVAVGAVAVYYYVFSLVVCCVFYKMKFNLGRFTLFALGVILTQVLVFLPFLYFLNLI